MTTIELVEAIKKKEHEIWELKFRLEAQVGMSYEQFIDGMTELVRPTVGSSSGSSKEEAR